MRRMITAEAVRGVEGEAADALVVDGGRIEWRGMAHRWPGEAVQTTSFPGMVIVPGLRDAHIHPVPYAAGARNASLAEATDLAGVAERLADAADRVPAAGAVVARRLSETGLAEQRLPTRHDLDAATGGRPVLVHRVCGHVAVASTAALERAGLTPTSPDPPGGIVDRDEAGNPTGVVREAAVATVARALQPLVPPLDPDDLVAAMTDLAATGLTGIGAMVGLGGGPWAELGDELEVIVDVADRLPLRLHAFVIANTPAELEHAAGRLAGFSRLRFAGWKGFADGSLGGRTAALSRDYADDRGNRGRLLLDHHHARRMIAAALALGGKAAVHAIGDRANAAVLDLFATVIATGADPADLRVEHASVLGSAEIAAFSSTGVVASVQPAFLASEASWLAARVGRERLPHTYPFSSLAAAGVPLAGGSDCPVEPPDPLPGMAAARDRGGLTPSERLSPEQALALFTAGAAAAIGEEAALVPGAAADFTVLGGDPLTSPPEELRRMEVRATFVAGEEVGGRGAGAGG